jgi:hypothetical protein
MEVIIIIFNRGVVLFYNRGRFQPGFIVGGAYVHQNEVDFPVHAGYLGIGGVFYGRQQQEVL